MTRRSLAMCVLCCLAVLGAAGCGGPSESLADSQERQEVQMKFEHGEEDAGMGEMTDETEQEQAPSEDADTAEEPATDGSEGGDEADMVALSDADLEQARGLFSTSCGGCHALSDAGAGGAAGPGLDDTQLSAAEIETQIINGKGAMPGGILTGDDATLVANYIAQVTSK